MTTKTGLKRVTRNPKLTDKDIEVAYKYLEQQGIKISYSTMFQAILETCGKKPSRPTLAGFMKRIKKTDVSYDIKQLQQADVDLERRMDSLEKQLEKLLAIIIKHDIKPD